jgi:glycosyltransferase involved in cell wall biosynthesis
LERRRLGRFERKISTKANCSLFVSHAEADSFKTSGGTGRIAIIPNGVDSEVRRLPLRNLVKQGRNVIAPKMVFVGTMNYFPNIDAVLHFVQNTWPLVRKKYRLAEFHVVGRYPPRCIRSLDGSNGIRVFGEVPNVAPYLLAADVSVAPLRIARGVQNKVLEAMAIGVPVVASTQAVKGIQVEGEVDILVADDPADFARQVIRILKDIELYQAIVNRARIRVFESYSWQNVGTQLEQILAGLAKPASPEFAQARPR